MKFLFIPLAVLIAAYTASAMEDGTEDPLIKLNVGGQTYIYPKSMLINFSDYFKPLLSGNFKNTILDDGSIFISYSQEAFKEVDHFLTTGKLLLCHNMETIIDAFNFFCIELPKAKKLDFNLQTDCITNCPECWVKFGHTSLSKAVDHLISKHKAVIKDGYNKKDVWFQTITYYSPSY